MLTIEMNFLPDVYVPCEICKGKRYNREALEIHYKGKTIADVLDMTVEEALQLLSSGALDRKQAQHPQRGRPGLHPPRSARHHALRRRGPAHQAGDRAFAPRHGPHACTSSTSRPPACTSPTSNALLQVLQRLVDTGNTVVVIEHNLDVIKSADWVIDLGPEGGDRGGQIITEGTPEEVAQVPASYTGQFLAPLLRATARLCSPLGLEGLPRAASLMRICAGDAPCSHRDSPQRAVPGGDHAERVKNHKITQIAGRCAGECQVAHTGRSLYPLYRDLMLCRLIWILAGAMNHQFAAELRAERSATCGW